MNYFSKNKKWMAYLILLTFVFTCIVPSNLSGWNSEAEAAEYSSATVFLERGGTRQLESSYLPSDGTTVMWKSNNTACATVSDSGAVTKVGYGETTVVASWSTGTENHKITWTISDGVKQTAYFYIWKPGAETSGTYQETWYYTGEGEVLVPGARASENKYYDCANIVTKYPSSESYPTITVDNQEYRYDVTGSGENYTYTVNWAYIVDTYGANDGHITIASSPSYHVDGYAVLKTPTQVTVDFEVLNPRTDGFKSVDGWPKIYDENTAITAPRLATSQSIDGVTYYLSNWYKDAACTVKAAATDFTAKTNVTFYAKYEPVFSISATGYAGVYDGKQHTSTVIAPNASLVEYSSDGVNWSEMEPTIRDVGEARYQVRATLDGVTKATEFTLKISPRPVTLTSATDTKVYNGTALTNDTVAVSGDGFVEGEGAVYTVTGTQTNVGTSNNTFTYTLNDGTKADNYTISKAEGTLTVTRNDNAQYKVQYWYQNPETGKYDIFGGKEMRSTTAGSLAFITEEDTVATRAMYRFNAALSDIQKTVHVYPKNPDQDKQEYTTLNVFFDALYNVVYRYTDGTETYDVASSGYVYGYEDYVIAPGMQSIDQFDGKWYKDSADAVEWEFGVDKISSNTDLIADKNTIYLYTKAQVTPLDNNTIRVWKKAVNEPDGDVTYLFNLQLIVDAPVMSAPLTGDAATTLHSYNTAKITAEGEYNDALAALKKAESNFEKTVFKTTRSGLDFIMYDGGAALFAIGATGSAYGYETTSSVYEYNLFEDSFAVEKDSNVEGGIVEQIINFIKGFVKWRTPLQTLNPEMALYGLQAAGLSTSGSALAFEYDAASDLFLAAKELIGKEAAYEEAKEALNNYMESVGRIAVLTVNGEQFILNEKDADGKYIYAQDKNGNFIWSRDFGLKNGAFKDFKVEVSTGSSVQFIITETYDGGADVTKVNGVTTHSVYGFVTTGSTYLFENIFEEEDGGGWNPEIPTNPEETPSEPSTEPPEDSEEPNGDENIPVQGPEEFPVTEPDKILEEPEFPLGDAPATGDTNNVVPFMAMMIFALCGLADARRKFN